MPGLFPGRVVSVSHPGCLVDGKFQAAPISRMVHDGMVDLTGAPDLTSAWRLFFERGDLVGIKRIGIRCAGLRRYDPGYEAATTRGFFATAGDFPTAIRASCQRPSFARAAL